MDPARLTLARRPLASSARRWLVLGAHLSAAAPRSVVVANGPFVNPECPSSPAMEYGFVIQNFWNNANQHVVPDPFGVVK